MSAFGTRPGPEEQRIHGHPSWGAPAGSRRWRWPRLAALLGLLAVGVAVAGCGGSSDKTSGVASLGDGKATATTSPGGSSDPRQAALAYARCMRQHGVNLPDPTFSRNGGIRLQGPPKSDGTGPDHPKFKAAQQACNKYLKYLPNGGRKPTDQQLLAFARCMRQHGINLPDPGPRGGIDLRANGVNPESPEFKAAQQACWRSSGFLR